MDSKKDKVEEANIEFYNELYKKRNIFIQLVYPFISFDQQSKSKFNYRSIKKVLAEIKDLRDFNFLDYGFGHGSLLLKLPRKVGLFGCDISVEAVANFPRVAKLLGKKVQTYTPEQLNKNKALKLNMISLSHVLEHVEDDIQLLKELWANLQPGGYVLINVPINEVWDDPKHVRKYTPDSMRNVLERAGFAICSVEEKNKLSGFLLINERVKKPGIIKKLFFRSFRLFLALMPLSFIESFDKILGESYKYQHLIVLAQKNG
jgi:SAM-dependent methyltransferase